MEIIQFHTNEEIAAEVAYLRSRFAIHDRWIETEAYNRLTVKKIDIVDGKHLEKFDDELRQLYGTVEEAK